MRFGAPIVNGQRKPRLLDLFCGAGGASMGYSRAGFDVYGVDIARQSNYPRQFDFWQYDALLILRDWQPFLRDFDAIHASPPCQAYSVTRTLHESEYPKLIAEVRSRLIDSGVPWVIENVVGSELQTTIRLCGSMFGLGVWRHRDFESSQLIMGKPACQHELVPEPIDVTGTGSRRIGERPDGKGGNSRKPRNITEASEAMGIGWMTRKELSEAIPPAYTEWIGSRLMEQIEVAA